MEKTFVYNGTKYTLTYTLDVIRALESSGFMIEKLDSQRATNIPMLFAGALMTKHKGLKSDDIEKIYKSLPNKAKLISMLEDMYRDTLRQLVDEPDEETGNLVTEVSW